MKLAVVALAAPLLLASAACSGAGGRIHVQAAPPVTDDAAKSASAVVPSTAPPVTTTVAPVSTTVTTAAPRSQVTSQVVAAAPSRAAPTPAKVEAATSEKTFAGYTLHTNSDGTVVRWNPCAVIRWRANLTLAPPGALEEVTAAFAALASATGMTFRYDGPTTAVPTAAWRNSSADSGLIVVAWVPRAATDLLGAGASGEGGWYEQGTKTGSKPWVWQIVRGFVVIDPAATSGYAKGFTDGVSMGALVLHELGHAAGLGHTTDATQLMTPVLTGSTKAHYGAGDLAGLAAVGHGAGCITG